MERIDFTAKIRPGRKRLPRGSLGSESAKKQRKKEIDAYRQRSRINIGKEFDRWKSVMEANSIQAHEEFATLLLDSYESHSHLPVHGPISAYSTPLVSSHYKKATSNISSATNRLRDFTPSEHVNKAHLFTDEEIDTLIDDKVYLVYMSELKKLLSALEGNCHEEGCSSSEPTQSHYHTEGTTLRVKWVCSNDHVDRTWCSQPLLHQEPPGDFMTSASMLCSGINFKKMSFFAKLMNLQFVTLASFDEVKRNYSVPSMDTLVQMTPSETVFQPSTT